MQEQRQYHHKQLEESGSSLFPERAEAVPTELARRCFVVDRLCVATLNRTHTISRQAMHIVTPALMAAGVDVSRLMSHHSTPLVEMAASSSHRPFYSHPDVALVAHFNGKLLPNSQGEKSYRMTLRERGSKSCSAFYEFPTEPTERIWATLSSSFCGIWRACRTVL